MIVGRLQLRSPVERPGPGRIADLPAGGAVGSQWYWVNRPEYLLLLLPGRSRGVEPEDMERVVGPRLNELDAWPVGLGEQVDVVEHDAASCREPLGPGRPTVAVCFLPAAVLAWLQSEVPGNQSQRGRKVDAQ